MSDMHSRYRSVLRSIAAHLAGWRAAEDLEVHEMAEETGIEGERLRSALLADNWQPGLDDMAKIEVATGMEVVVTLRDNDTDS